jgi:hypothetical protein
MAVKHILIVTDLKLPQTITVAAWVKPEITNKPQIILFKADQFLLRIDPPEEGGAFSFFININGRWEPRVSSRVIPVENHYYHVVGTYDGSWLRIYVNGELKGETFRRGNLWRESMNEPILIGGPLFFQGVIKDVRIYDYALSHQEVRELYSGNVRGDAIMYDGTLHKPGCLVEALTKLNRSQAIIYVYAKLLGNNNKEFDLNFKKAFIFRIYEENNRLVYEKIITSEHLRASESFKMIPVAQIYNIDPKNIYKFKILVQNGDLRLIVKAIAIKSITG